MNKLIMLYGFAASGKSTLAKKYIDDNPLAIAIETDQIIGMIGQWRTNERAARELVSAHVQSITKNHLKAGHDVIVPCLLSELAYAHTFAEIAKHNNTVLYEIYIKLSEDDAVHRLISRGCWGEEGSRELTEDDRHELTDRFKHMEMIMQQLPNTQSISSAEGDITNTYQALLHTLK